MCPGSLHSAQSNTDLQFKTGTNFLLRKLEKKEKGLKMRLLPHELCEHITVKVERLPVLRYSEFGVKLY
jgi:hypothetical protein